MKKVPIIFFTILFCFNLNVGYAKTNYEDLVKRNGLYYKKFSDTPFTGKIDSLIANGSFIGGKKHGIWVRYYQNGNLASKGEFKNGIEEGLWVEYHSYGQIYRKGIYKNGKREGVWIELDALGKRYPIATITKINGMHVFTSGSGTYKNGIRVNDEGKPIDPFRIKKDN